MTWETERSLSGKQPFQFVEIEVDRCSRTYGDAFLESPLGSPVVGCQAQVGVTGADKCYNSWATCQDTDNFNRTTFWIRFSEAVSDLPRSFVFDVVSPSEEGLAVFLPFLDSVTYAPGMPDPGQSLGLRSRLTVKLNDAPHHDIGVDKYISERSFDAMGRGTFLRKMKARWPHYIGRRLRWYQGYITSSPSLNDFRVREYVMEQFEGPGADGTVSIIAKDVLKLLDDERAQAPLKSKGSLLIAMASGATPTFIDVSTSDLAEYDLTGSPSVGYVRVGGEVITYLGTAAQSANVVRLTGVTRSAPSPYTTQLESHDAGDAVQLCLYLSGTIPEVVQELMVSYGGIDQTFVPFSDWESEATTWLAGDDIQRLITEPEGLKSIIDEIVQQTLTWSFWFDEVESEIKFRAVRPLDIGDTLTSITDDANIVAGSVKLIDNPDAVINEVQVLYGQIDPTKQRDLLENYRNGLVVVNSDSQSTNEIGQRRIKRIFSRWNPATNESVVLRYAERTLASRAKNLATIEFQLDRKDEGVDTSQFVDLQTLYLIDAFGASQTKRFQVLRVDSSSELVKYRAMEDFFGASLFGRWAPDGLSSPDGLLWSEATQAQRDQYMFWADDNGQLGSSESPANLTDGKTWA